jgi:hypothetical protein
VRNDAVHDDVSRAAVVRAVAARTDDLPVVVGVEVLDGDSTETIELDDLIACMESAAAVYVGCPRRLLEGPGVC